MQLKLVRPSGAEQINAFTAYGVITGFVRVERAEQPLILCREYRSDNVLFDRREHSFSGLFEWNELSLINQYFCAASSKVLMYREIIKYYGMCLKVLDVLTQKKGCTLVLPFPAF